jgi:hypothetical protein
MANQVIIIPKKELKTVIKESVREVLNQEVMNLRALLLPFVSQAEQRDIERRYKKPVRQTAKSIEIEI